MLLFYQRSMEGLTGAMAKRSAAMLGQNMAALRLAIAPAYRQR